MTERQFRFLSVLISLLGGCAIYYATSLAPWGFSDSAAYLVTARNFASGRGFGMVLPSGGFVPPTVFPPLYPLILSIAGPGLDETLTLARWLGIAGFAALCGMVVLNVYRLGRSHILALTLGLLVLSTPMLIYLYSGVMTEVFFLFFSTGALLALAWALNAGNKPWLVLSAGLSALALFSRYAGLALVGVGFLSILSFERGSLLRRLGWGISYAGLSAGPMAVWRLYMGQALRATELRHLALPVNSFGEAFQKFRLAFIEKLWSFLPLPERLAQSSYRLHLVLLALTGLALAALVIYSWLPAVRRATIQNEGLRLLAAISMIYIIGYVLFLAAASLVVSPPPDINPRTLTPLLPALWLCSGASLVLISRSQPALRLLQLLFFTLSLFFVLGSLPQDIKLLTRLHNEGEGYISSRWRNSALIDLVRNLPVNIPLISNETAPILLYTDRPAYDIPELIQKIHKSTFTRFGDELDDPVQKVFREDGAALVLFNTVRWQFDPIYYEETPSRLSVLTGGLYLAQDTYDGGIYYYRER